MIDGISPLPAEEQLELLRDGSPKAIDRLVRSNQGLIANIAQRHKNLGLSYEDLMAEGNVGLMNAVRLFDTELGFNFSTYAHYAINTAIKCALTGTTRLVKPPAVLIQRAYALCKQRALTPDATTTELAISMACREQDVQEAMEFVDNPRAIISITEIEQEYRSGFIEEEEENYDLDNKELISKYFGFLNERQQLAINLKYGLNDYPECKLTEIGRHLGVTKERARQVINEAIDVIRDRLNSKQKTLFEDWE